MKIIFDYPAFGRSYGGVSRYFYEVISRLKNMDAVEPRVIAGLYSNQHLRLLDSSTVWGHYFPYVGGRKFGPYKLRFNRFLGEASCRTFHPNILHETYHIPKPVQYKGCKRVITVHDMISYHYPSHDADHDMRISMNEQSITRADHIICVSERTKMDLQEILNISDDKISVIHHGVSKTGNASTESPIGSPYILYVGNRGSYKNSENLIRAYVQDKELAGNIKLVFLGQHAASEQEKRMILESGLPEGSILFFSGNDDKLATLYQHAVAFIFPSQYEGFGMPLLEAMTHNCPVLCARASCFPEVAGDAAEYFDPMSLDSIATAIRNVVFDADRADELRARGRERIKQFSWEKCAEEHLKVYRSLL